MDDGSAEQNQSIGAPAQRVRTMQIIALALMMGVVFFGVVALFIGINKQPGDPFLAIFAAVFAGIMTVTAMFAPSLVARSQGMQDAIDKAHPANDAVESSQAREAAKLAAVYQTKMIITLALYEGAAFFNLVVYIDVVQWWSLAIAGGLLALMAISFPTRQRIDNWIQFQLEMRQFE